MDHKTEYCFSAKTRFLSMPVQCLSSAWHCITSPQGTTTSWVCETENILLPVLMGRKKCDLTWYGREREWILCLLCVYEFGHFQNVNQEKLPSFYHDNSAFWIFYIKSWCGLEGVHIVFPTCTFTQIYVCICVTCSRFMSPSRPCDCTDAEGGLGHCCSIFVHVCAYGGWLLSP